MRKNDIEELLQEVKHLNKGFAELLKNAKFNEEIEEVTRPKVKTCLEHLRTCLDYCSKDIYEKYLAPSDGLTEKQREKNRKYFPYGKTKNDFKSMMGSNLPQLEQKATEIYKLLEDLQPYICGDNWLVTLCQTTNETKHDNLKKQERVEAGNTKLEIGKLFDLEGNSRIDFKGEIYINNEKMKFPSKISITDKSKFRELREKIDDRIEIRKEHEKVDFIFKDSNINVIELIENSINKVEDFTQKIYNEIK